MHQWISGHIHPNFPQTPFLRAWQVNEGLDSSDSSCTWFLVNIFPFSKNSDFVLPTLSGKLRKTAVLLSVIQVPTNFKLLTSTLVKKKFRKIASIGFVKFFKKDFTQNKFNTVYLNKERSIKWAALRKRCLLSYGNRTWRIKLSTSFSWYGALNWLPVIARKLIRYYSQVYLNLITWVLNFSSSCGAQSMETDLPNELLAIKFICLQYHITITHRHIHVHTHILNMTWSYYSF